MAIETFVLLVAIGFFLKGNAIIQNVTDYDPNIKMCNIITGVEDVDTSLWGLRCLCKYNLWVYPIVKVLWPKGIKQMSYIDSFTPSEIDAMKEVLEEGSNIRNSEEQQKAYCRKSLIKKK